MGELMIGKGGCGDDDGDGGDGDCGDGDSVDGDSEAGDGGNDGDDGKER